LTWPSSIPAPVFSSKACVACSRVPAAEATAPPSYIHDVRSYVPVSGSKPENTPPRSSVSWKRSSMSVAAFVYRTT
jgi:hypothetical protein